MKTLDHAAEITRLERERDLLDQRWRQLRHTSVQTIEQGRARDLQVADIEIRYRETELQIARMTLEARERRLASVDDVDADVMAQAESEYFAAKTLYDELQGQQRAAYSRRQDAQADVTAARQVLREAEHALEQRRQRRDEIAARPLRGMAPAAVWVGDGRS